MTATARGRSTTTASVARSSSQNVKKHNSSTLFARVLTCSEISSYLVSYHSSRSRKREHPK